LVAYSKEKILGKGKLLVLNHFYIIDENMDDKKLNERQTLYYIVEENEVNGCGRGMKITLFNHNL